MYVGYICTQEEKHMAFLQKYLPILALKHVLQIIKKADSRKLRSAASQNCGCSMCYALFVGPEMGKCMPDNVAI